MGNKLEHVSINHQSYIEKAVKDVSRLEMEDHKIITMKYEEKKSVNIKQELGIKNS